MPEADEHADTPNLVGMVVTKVTYDWVGTISEITITGPAGTKILNGGAVQSSPEVWIEVRDA